MTELKFPPLHYSIARLFAVERYLGRKVSDILAEMNSDTGTSITTLSALIAAGRIDKTHEGVLGTDGLELPLRVLLTHATDLIERHGVQTAAAAMATALGAFLPTVER